MKRQTKQKLRKFGKFCLMVAGSGCVIALGFYRFQHYFTLNITASMPVGLYKFAETEITVNDDVLLCPPEEAANFAVGRKYLLKGSCPGGSVPLIKQVAALPGDNVRVDENGISVNGVLLPKTKPLKTDSLGREMPKLDMTKKLKKGECLVVSHDDEKGYDSRYFGVVDFQRLKKVEPFLVAE